MDVDGLRQELVEWLTGDGASIRFLDDLFAELCKRLVAMGLPLERATMHLRTLHPQFQAARFLWAPGMNTAELRRVTGPIFNQPAFLNSPVRALYEGAEGLRQRLDLGADMLDGTFPIYAELSADGFTDYAALPLVLSNGQRIASSWTTRRPGGWHTEELMLIDGVRPVFAMAAEVRITRRIMRTLMETYLGERTGARVLEGRIDRGGVEHVEAAVGFIDLRGSSIYAEHAPQAAVIRRLNAFFETFGEPLVAAGGEILKFMGDAMLAVFVAADHADAADRAVAAARQGFADLVLLNEDLREAGEPPIACGLALHWGEVAYGNVGTPTRLDFTVIGPAVNLAARLQELGRNLGEPLVLSEHLARRCSTRNRSIGRHGLRSLDRRIEVFVPAEELLP
ncbi:MAG: adenylate/guanylate cyclase domain-containing protein [Pseudomonadota bacterium]